MAEGTGIGWFKQLWAAIDSVVGIFGTDLSTALLFLALLKMTGVGGILAAVAGGFTNIVTGIGTMVNKVGVAGKAVGISVGRGGRVGAEDGRLGHDRDRDRRRMMSIDYPVLGALTSPINSGADSSFVQFKKVSPTGTVTAIGSLEFPPGQPGSIAELSQEFAAGDGLQELQAGGTGSTGGANMTLAECLSVLPA